MTHPDYDTHPDGTMSRKPECCPVIDYANYWGHGDHSTIEDQRFNVHGLNINGMTKAEFVLQYCIGPHLLEIGCAPGAFLKLAREKGFMAYGVEPFEHYAQAIREYSGCGVLTGYFEDLEILARFDTVVAMDVLEHIQDGKSFIHKCLSLLKPGGRVVLMLPAIFDDGQFDERQFLPEHLWLYSQTRLSEWMHPVSFDRWTVGHEIVVSIPDIQ